MELRSTITTTHNVRWAFFQDPFLVEDALGHKFLVPSEYDFDMLDQILKMRFRQGPGSADVQVGNYKIFVNKNSQQPVTSTTRLIPGTALTMAILLSRSTMSGDFCPMPRCYSKESTPVASGGRIWCV